MKHIEVDLEEQKVEAFEDGQRVFEFICVSGDDDHPTDKGEFHIFRKEHPYRSKTYNVPMDYAMFFTDDGKALHQYHGPVPLSVVRTMKQEVSEWYRSGSAPTAVSDWRKTRPGPYLSGPPCIPR